jgi:DNA-binding NarL/FixJ family response regulator
MRVLCVVAKPQSAVWLSEAFCNDSASQVILEEAVGSVAGLVRLRDEMFDAVLVSHAPGEIDALDLIEGYRTGGSEEPIIVLGRQSDDEMAALCYEVGADGYVSIQTTTRNLLWVVARAVQRHRLVNENQRLALAEQTRLQREQTEAASAFEQQQEILAQADQPTPDIVLPDALVSHYRELLRTYVIMGTGNLADELAGLAEMLVLAGLSSKQVFRLHLQVLGELVQGLGSRSARHLMSRADVLIIELSLRMAEGYRVRYDACIHPPVQQMLPGFC